MPAVDDTTGPGAASNEPGVAGAQPEARIYRRFQFSTGTLLMLVALTAPLFALVSVKTTWLAVVMAMFATPSLARALSATCYSPRPLSTGQVFVIFVKSLFSAALMTIPTFFAVLFGVAVGSGFGSMPVGLLCGAIAGSATGVALVRQYWPAWPQGLAAAAELDEGTDEPHQAGAPS